MQAGATHRIGARACPEERACCQPVQPRPLEDSGRATQGLLGGGSGLLLFFLALARLRRSVAFKGRADAAFHDAIADADELKNRSSASITEAGLGQPEDAGVATRAIGEPRRHFVEKDEDGLLVAQELQTATA